jgi:hypothetical protein
MTPEELKTLAASVKSAKEYADVVFKPSLTECGGLLSDTIGFWRLKNRAKILTKAKKYLEDRGIDPAKVLPDVFVPLLEAGGDTDDETLSGMFARLLATHLDPAMQNTVHPSFAKTLGQMSPLDAKVLQLIDKKEERAWRMLKAKEIDEPWRWSDLLVVEEAKRKFGDVSAGKVTLSLENLDRLGLTKDETLLYELAAHFGGVSGPGLVITRYGARLLVAIADKSDYWRVNPEVTDEKIYRMAEAGWKKDAEFRGAMNRATAREAKKPGAQ